MKTLYHGSKTPNIKILKPQPNNAVDGESVIFATNDPLFAMAMTFGTGKELAVGYFINKKTNSKNMYIDELKKGSLRLLENVGYLYEVEGTKFTTDKRLMPEELVSHSEVKVLRESRIPNILNYLKINNVEIVRYENVPKEMKARNNDMDNPKNPHSKDRFSSIGQI